jgi:hypothetical protein
MNHKRINSSIKEDMSFEKQSWIKQETKSRQNSHLINDQLKK